MNNRYVAAIAVALCMLAAPSSLLAQKKNINVDPAEVAAFFNEGNYEDALDGYLQLLEKDPRNEKYNYNVAVCYLNTNISKAKAIPYLEIVTRIAKHDPNAEYLLGRAYHFAYRFDDAIKLYTKFKETGRGTSSNLKDVDRQIQYCYNAKELIKYPVNVTFENLGKTVNSQYPDYYPYIPADETFLVYNSKRPEGSMRAIDGAYTANIYISKVANSAFQKSKSIGAPVNTAEGDEEVIGLTSDGKTMLIYYDNLKGFGDIYSVDGDKNNNFKKPVILDENINSAGATEIAASISPDGNTLYFASDRSGGIGGTDIYVSKKLPTGLWGPPLNLGPNVNTQYDEDFPNISADGKTLYFSSKGHTSMGGYDIFRADWDEASNSWAGIKNYGYPINTPEDDMNLRLSETGRYGYIAALREGGLGDLDIYRVTFTDIEAKYSVVKGHITSIDSTQKISYSDVFITLTDTKTGEIIGNYVPNPNTGRYVIIIPPGNYTMSVEAPGYQVMNEKIDLADKVNYKTEMEKSLKLLPEGYKPPEPVKTAGDPKKK
jgi:Tol biopolymer transport system component